MKNKTLTSLHGIYKVEQRNKHKVISEKDLKVDIAVLWETHYERERSERSRRSLETTNFYRLGKNVLRDILSLPVILKSLEKSLFATVNEELFSENWITFRNSLGTRVTRSYHKSFNNSRD